MDYKFIRAWCKMLGSFSYFVKNEVEQARRDNAPQNAVYRNADGRWVTYDEITSERTRERVTAIVGMM